MKRILFNIVLSIFALIISVFVNAQDLSIGSGTTFSLGSATFTLPGNWTNAGTFTPGTGTVVFSGSGSDQNITNASGETFYNLTINSGAKVVIGPGQTVSVTNTLANNGGSEGLLIDSDASGTGKLVNNTTGVEGMMGHYLVKDQWHYMGIPFDKTDSADVFFYGCYVAKNDESKAEDDKTTGWGFMTENDTVSPGIGYAVYYTPNDTTLYISGTFNTGANVVTTACTAADRGWNLISNPYPCTIDWETVNGNLSNVNDALYVWNPTLNSGDGNYATWIDGTGTNGQDQYIAPMQGFFVKANTGAGSVTFTNVAKTASASTFKNGTLQSAIRLEVSSPGNKTDETVVRIKSNATNGFDGAYDAHKLFATGPQTPQLYSSFNGDDYSINSIPKITEETVIPIQVLIKQDGEHTIALTELGNYGYAYPVMLYDPSTEELTNLESDAYSFTASAGETVSLLLVFTKNMTGVETIDLSNISIKLIGRQLQVSGLGTGKSTITIYNTMGQVLNKGMTTTDSYTKDNVPRSVLLIRAQKDSGEVVVKKVVVK